MARDCDFACNFGLGSGAVENTRVLIILVMGLMTFCVRAAPQLFFIGQKFPEAWDRLLRYLSYSFICSIIAVTLFLTGAKFDPQAAPYRGLALAITIAIARKTKSAATGMLAGTVLVILFSWFR
jgi:branched-subunit amino acid transport protein